MGILRTIAAEQKFHFFVSFLANTRGGKKTKLVGSGVYEQPEAIYFFAIRENLRTLNEPIKTRSEHA